MGNVVQSGRQRKAKHEQTLAVVRAAGAFKAKLKQSKMKTTTEQIDEILEWKFRRRKAGARKLDSINELQEETKDNIEPSKEVLKFLRSVDIGDKCNKLSVTNTSVAWDALRELALQDSIVSQPPPTQTNRLKKIADMIRFVRRTSAEAGLLKVSGDDISYNDTFTPRWETDCHLCHQPSCPEDSALNSCRICPHVYHTRCLESRGYLSGKIARDSLKLSTTPIGWSCFNCENLFDLLTDREKIDVMEAFDRMDTNQDSIISKQEYLEYQKDSYRKLLGIEMPGYRVNVEEDTFKEMDRNDTGVIDWWEFIIPMCVRKLTGRKKKTLAPLLTKQEISNFREFFKALDPEGEGEISKHTSRLVYKNWYLSLINRPREEIPVGDWLGSEWIMDIEPDKQSIHQRCDVVKWKDFVLSHALYIFAARPNIASTRPYIPRMENLVYEFEEEDDDDE